MLVYKFIFMCLIINLCLSFKDEPIQIYTTSCFFFAISNQTFGQAFDPSKNIEFILSVTGRADLPNWMHFKHSKASKLAFIYGSPLKKGDIEIEIIALDKYTYDTHKETIRFKVSEKKNPAKYEVEMKLSNLNVEDIFNLTYWNQLLAIFKNIIWKESKELYFTQILSPIDVGAKVPINPNDKEGLIFRIGSVQTFSKRLIELVREIEPIKNRNPCPRNYKYTRYEHYFRSKGFICDWCTFKLIQTEYKFELNNYK